MKLNIALAGVLVAGLALPAAAQTVESYYVVQDAKTKKCTIVDKKPTTTEYTVVGGDGVIYKTRTEAESGDEDRQGLHHPVTAVSGAVRASAPGGAVGLHNEFHNCRICWRCPASGRRPYPAFKSSAMCCGFLVAGITQVIAGSPIRYLRKSCAQPAASNSAAQRVMRVRAPGGTVRPPRTAG